MAGKARADLITVTAGGTSFSAGADTAVLNPATHTYNLTPGQVQTAVLQVVNFNVGDSGPLNQTFPFTLTESITVGTTTGSLSLPGQLSITPTRDTLTFFNGPPTFIDLGAGRTLRVNVVNGSVSATNLGTFPMNLQANFLEITPEPPSIVLFGLGVAGLAGYAWRWRARTRRVL
jgi:PEP-CTERM motif